ncbi:MAG: porin [Marinobacter sp.]|nr:porin [Marinobacter sp.]
MMFKNRLAMAIFAAGISTQVAAVELGEFNGTKLSIGGYVKAEGIVDMPDEGDQDFEGSMRQTRLNFSAAKEVDGHKLKAFVEADFWDNNTTPDDSTYAPRMRHAYITVDNLTVGQTWNGQFFANAPFDVEMLNFWGPGTGTIAGNGAVVRPDLVVHYTLGGLRLTAQDPVWSEAAYPDMVAAYTYRTSGHAFNLAVTGREVGTGGAPGDDSEFGAAVSAAAKLQFADTTLALSAYTGEGAGVYAGWGYNGARGADQSVDVNDQGDLITTTGFSAGVTQKFMDNLRGTVRYGQVEADEVAATMEEDTLKMVNVNLIYTYMPGLDFGIEWRDQNAATRPPTAASSSMRPEGQQVEIMAMYKF